MIGLRRCVPPRLAPGVRTEIRKSEDDEAAKRTKNAAHENAYIKRSNKSLGPILC